MRRLLLTETTLLLLGAERALGQATTPVPGSGPDNGVQPLGLPVATWVAILLGSGGSAVIGKELLTAVKSGVAVLKSYSDDYPARLKAEREQEGVETLKDKEEVRFAQILNEALAQRDTAIAGLQANALQQATLNTQMQGNSTEQALLITKLQSAMLEQHTSHKTEMDALTGRLNDVQKQVDMKDGELQIALSTAASYKSKWEEAEGRVRLEEERRIAAEQECARLAQELQGMIAKYETPGKADLAEVSQAADDLPSSTTLTPGVPS